MNYFQPYLPPLDNAIVAAWDSQIAEAAETPLLAQATDQRGTMRPQPRNTPCDIGSFEQR
jgi:hypothetical protein